ncbi:MAG: hypothetical protein KGJ64_00370, partial [Betaproteobacteria bacterium]|nr:hypothetical protein [Betaproteobacteria bacterium]
MKSLLARLSALPGRPLAALSIAAVLLVVVNLWGPWLGIGGARPLASPPIRWALLVIVLWGLLLWSLRRSLGGPLLGLLGLFILCGGQALGWGELRPLRALAARVLVVGLLVLGYLAWLGLRTWRRHGREHDLRQLLAALRRLLLPTPAERTHTPTAVTQVRAAQQQWRQLHARVGWRGAWQAWRARSTLPWYLVLGAAGSGKSSLLASSSLRLLRCEGEAFHRPDGDPCSWWVGERAMFVEAQALPEHPPTRSPGEPAASAADSGSVAAALPVAAEPARPADSGVSAEPVGSAWGALLGALHRRGAELALHGVVLTLECAWLLRASPEQRAEAAGLMRRRLLQLHATLGSHLPVYLVLTKADSLTGFEEFFRAVDTHARGGLRDALWGFILPWGRSGAASPGRALEVGQEFALLQQGLQALLPVCLQHEAALARRCRMFEFPHAHAELSQRLQEWLQIVFAQWPGPQTRARAWAPDDGPASGAAHGAAHGTARGLVLRGVFLGRCGGLRDSSPDAGSGERFTAGLLRDGLLEDTALARPDDPRLRRRRVRRGAAAGAMLIGGAAALYGLHASYAQ